jgi:hypothetical protein
MDQISMWVRPSTTLAEFISLAKKGKKIAEQKVEALKKTVSEPIAKTPRTLDTTSQRLCSVGC